MAGDQIVLHLTSSTDADCDARLNRGFRRTESTDDVALDLKPQPQFLRMGIITVGCQDEGSRVVFKDVSQHPEILQWAVEDGEVSRPQRALLGVHFRFSPKAPENAVFHRSS